MRGSLWFREIRRLRTTPATWVVAVVTLFFSGLVFIVNLDTYWQWDLTGLVTSISYLLLFMAPALTMQSVAGEREQQTWELIRSDPLKPSSIVLTKYLVIFVYYSVLVLLTAVTALYFIAQKGGDFDVGRQATSLVAHLLLAGFYLAIGMACSAHCRTSLVSFFVTFSICLGLILIGSVGAGAVGPWARWLGVDGHLQSFRLGLLAWKDIFYFGTGIAIALILAVRAVVMETQSPWRLFSGGLWVLLWIGLQPHGDQLKGAYDVSRFKLSVPSSQALSRLQGHVQGVHVISVWDSQEQRAPLVRSYLDHLQHQLPEISLRHLDLASDQEIILNLWQDRDLSPEQLQWPGGILLSFGTHHYFVPHQDLFISTPSPSKDPYQRWQGEPLLVQGLLALNRSEWGRLAVLQAAGSETEGKQEHQLSFDRLRQKGFYVDVISVEQLDKNLYPVTFLCHPREKWSQHLQDQLKKYRAKGGKVVLCLEVGSTRLQDVVTAESLTLSGFQPPYRDWVAVSFPEYFQKSFGDHPVVMNQPIAFAPRDQGVLFKAQGYPVGVELADGFVEIGDVDWLRRSYQNNLSFANGVALLFLVEKLMGYDQHHDLASQPLDVEIAALELKTRDQIEKWLLWILPLSVAALGLMQTAVRRWL